MTHTLAESTRVVVVEDEPFTRRLVHEYLTRRGIEVQSFDNAKSAMEYMRANRVDAVVSDLDLGRTPSGVDLLSRVRIDLPQVALIALTAHANPVLAAPGRMPVGVTYLVKTDPNSLESLVAAVEGRPVEARRAQERAEGDDRITVTRSQAEVLRLLAEGLSNEAIAERRGVSKRAAEALVQRTLATLGLARENGRNPRVEAVRLWQQGRIAIR